MDKFNFSTHGVSPTAPKEMHITLRNDDADVVVQVNGVCILRIYAKSGEVFRCREVKEELGLPLDKHGRVELYKDYMDD